jgi:hypothetical protein
MTPKLLSDSVVRLVYQPYLRSRSKIEKRAVWYCVANAFSLLVFGIQPAGNDDKVKVLSPLDEPL